MAATESAPVGSNVRIVGVDHVAIPSRDPYAAACFYTAVLGAELVHETRHRSLFLGVKPCDGFMFDLFERGDEEVGADRGIIHHAFSIRAEDALTWVERLDYWRVPFFANPRRGNISIYFMDVDGNRLELYCGDLPDEIARGIQAGLYRSDGSLEPGNKNTLSEADQHPHNDRWPSPDRAEEANRQFQDKLARVRAGATAG